MQGRHQKSLKRLVLQMDNCGTDEDLYLEYLRCLVAVYERREKGDVLSAVELKKELSSCRKNGYQGKNTKSKGKGKSNSVIKALVENDSSNQWYGNVRDDCFYKIKLKGNLERRNIRRKVILDVIVCMNTSDQIFWNMIEKLIDLEESFI